MKRSIIIFLVAAMTAFSAAAQDGDTIRGRCERYFYPAWYDQCEFFDEPNPFVLGGDSIISFNIWNGFDLFLPGDTLALRVNVPRCMLIAGVAVMVNEGNAAVDYSSASDVKGNEYAMLMGDGEIPGDVLASARWDTAGRHAMVLSQDRRRFLAGGGYGDMAFTVYEAYFDSAVMVDSAFFMAGTFNSNRLVYEGFPLRFEGAPTFYGMVRSPYSYPCHNCIPKTWTFRYNTRFESQWLPLCPECDIAGPFIPIPAVVELAVETDSLTLGTVEGSGTFRSGDSTVIRATAAEDCRFVCWDDGVTANPRKVYLCGDATYTAHFVNDSSHTVRVLTNNPEWGSAYGGGVYRHGHDIEISAEPRQGFQFIGWADGDSNNPRTVNIMSDTVFTALFDPIPMKVDEAKQPLRFTVSPNPSHDMITVRVNIPDRYTLQVYDNRGHAVLEHRFDGDNIEIDVRTLASGIYMVALYSTRRPASKTFIKL